MCVYVYWDFSVTQRLIFSSLKPALVTHATNMRMRRMNMEEKISEKRNNERRIEEKQK